MFKTSFRDALLATLGIIVGVTLCRDWEGGEQLGTGIALAQNKPTAPVTLHAELQAIKDRLPDQAHAMADVGYQFANLWFAGEQENWPLADFYWNETRSHLRWAVRVIPVRKDSAGLDVDLRKILEAMENGPLAQLKQSIEAKDRAEFGKAYRFSIENCYACHKASEKPYLRPRIPATPASPMINFDPSATWPR